jgi:hypothetical protein
MHVTFRNVAVFTSSSKCHIKDIIILDQSDRVNVCPPTMTVEVTATDTYFYKILRICWYWFPFRNGWSFVVFLPLTMGVFVIYFYWMILRFWIIGLSCYLALLIFSTRSVCALTGTAIAVWGYRVARAYMSKIIGFILLLSYAGGSIDRFQSVVYIIHASDSRQKYYIPIIKQSSPQTFGDLLSTDVWSELTI